ncbi:MlaD family protein [Pontibacter akesuensis]|uniref:Phospholipid/cholesterol/gamma-HCH transport system substrate-binding protein n=1 Tax=Pontibacter akesuensis TaxID=388950 RepID=A0A1I7GDE8_9BACT|nr:MlaD family protein [Pontibacter akesuensis]GHA57373.1 ABC transporter substrate-binding protein [Pontibacter akesuensis]SFU46499.1 phospholipid/cholesterol/gamma-HCH transport system substrate-binding protein [Pontibacter akesuensis]
MKTEESKRAVMVGIFVLIAIIIFVVGVLTLGGQQKRFISSITVKTLFDDVEGLKVGNNVWYSGVKIGTVKAIDFYGDSQVEVVMNIEESAQRFIRQNAKARISSESLIGNKIIEIFGGTPAAEPIEDGDVLASEANLNTDDIMKTLQENNKNLATITSNFSVISDRLVKGEGTLGTLLTDSTLALNFQNLVASLEQTSVNTVKASRDLSRFTNQLNTEGSLASELLTDTTVFNRLQASMAQLQQATESAAQMTQNLQQTSQKLNNENNAVGVLLSDEEFANTLKQTMQNLETSTQKFDENMEALQSNILLRGFFKKRDKAEKERMEEAEEAGQEPEQQNQ